MKIAVPDLISNSYFPAPAGVELGFFEAEGLDMSYELIFPVDEANKAMRDGKVDFVAGSAHSTLAAFPGWDGAKLVCALSQGMYWLLIMRTDLGIERGDVEALKGLHIGAAPWVELGLRRLLREAGIDPDNDLTIAPVPGTVRPGVSFGVTAAKALEEGKIDGFWANAMGAEVAVRAGTGTVVLDPRRGLGPKPAFDYTWPTLATTDDLIAREPETVAAAVRAIVAVQAALVADVSRATEVGNKAFPAAEAAMIADVVARDLDYYDATIPESFVAGMNRFAKDMDLLDGPVAYDQVVATQFSGLWKG
jgi:ABC-type nitrate/sulfonate/bicarbonate transport system substrate-binding protein